MADLTQELEGELAASFSFFDAAFEGLAFLGWSRLAFDHNLLLAYDDETRKKPWDQGGLAPISDDGRFSFLYDVDNKTT